MNDNLRELAKNNFFKQVTVEKYRESFLQKLSIRTVIDKRNQGFYCLYCGKFSKMQQMPSGKDRVIFPNNNNSEIWIVNSHYDGCRGWD